MAVTIQRLAQADAAHKWVAVWGVGLAKSKNYDWPWRASGPFMIALSMRHKALYVPHVNLSAFVYSQAFHYALGLAMEQQARCKQLGCNATIISNEVYQFTP